MDYMCELYELSKHCRLVTCYQQLGFCVINCKAERSINTQTFVLIL